MQFGKEFNKVYIDLSIDMNNKEKQLNYIIDFLALKFNIL